MLFLRLCTRQSSGGMPPEMGSVEQQSKGPPRVQRRLRPKLMKLSGLGLGAELCSAGLRNQTPQPESHLPP